MDSQISRNIYLEAGKNILAELPLSMVLTDPNRVDNPIVYVNRAFEQLTGYAYSACVGRNCRFLQNDDRDQDAVRELARAIAAREATTVTIRNYRVTGESFLNRLMIAPVNDEEGQLFAFVGIQTQVLEERPAADVPVERFDDQLSEMQHRVKNHLQMVASMIRMQSRDETSGKGGYGLLARRVEALALLYDEFSHPPQGRRERRYDVVSAGSYVSRVAATVGALDGRRNVRVNVDSDPVYMRTERAAQLGLLTSEVVSNTLQHAFDGRIEGVVDVSLKQMGGDRVRLQISDDGVGMGDTNWPEEGNLGARIVRGLAQQLGGEVNVISTGSGTVITLDFDNVLDTSLEADGTRVLADADGARAGADARGLLGAEDRPKG
ncbi:sensor histidine kinase [Jannaschia ovalis]|uniref:PAS domain-containing protein n=1 Tax=Jannaschia ovalis TaxID=3038773 RepID=A0ABY8LAW8_9RHOB|nr:PAS domain-containing protein [Jannaschia sp. GRR-S6-38]WGH78286.1 PAS domain-containing protein [Jannaschia sp. GRR-S6-38]